jgi:hypothetical protein
VCPHGRWRTISFSVTVPKQITPNARARIATLRFQQSHLPVPNKTCQIETELGMTQYSMARVLVAPSPPSAAYMFFLGEQLNQDATKFCFEFVLLEERRVFGVSWACIVMPSHKPKKSPLTLAKELGSSVCEVGSSIPVHEDSEIKHQGQQNQH